jgi:hypothetical protein
MTKLQLDKKAEIAQLQFNENAEKPNLQLRRKPIKLSYSF